MSKSRPKLSTLTEYCDVCDTRTPHKVSIDLRTESTKETNRAFSREPYRVTECQHCGEQIAQRMNDA